MIVACGEAFYSTGGLYGAAMVVAVTKGWSVVTGGWRRLSDGRKNGVGKYMDVLVDADLYEQLWHECAGLSVKIPQKGDRVFYFPQGHIEQVNAFVEDRDDPTLLTYGLPTKVLFKVVDVTLKANPDTDEVFAKFVLLQIREGEGVSGCVRSVPVKNPSNCFRKIVTASDTSGLGGCGLPKADVAKAFPLLDASQERASQRLLAKDLHGARWAFEHVFRGTACLFDIIKFH
ncbi:auxin response factor 2A-like [Bidens hawaiensis]|uniref:auxin response factor 2A-like n=1 Tax=Bidens hawaiensis TaxID=980011 RepID=UPI004049DF49